jgi:hypothetical protein
MTLPKINNDNFLDRSDLETILKVNNKAIEIQTEIFEQYETVVEDADFIKKKTLSIDEKLAEIKTEIKEINKSQFKILVLLSAGVINLVVQIVSIAKH